MRKEKDDFYFDKVKYLQNHACSWKDGEDRRL